MVVVTLLLARPAKRWMSSRTSTRASLTLRARSSGVSSADGSMRASWLETPTGSRADVTGDPFLAHGELRIQHPQVAIRANAGQAELDRIVPFDGNRDADKAVIHVATQRDRSVEVAGVDADGRIIHIAGELRQRAGVGVEVGVEVDAHRAGG